MEVGRLSVGVEVTGLDKVSVAEKQTKQDTEKLQATLDKLSGSLDNVSAAAKSTAAAKVKLRDATKQASESSGNLGRAVREATTSLLGTNIATIALGTAIGNLATQAVSRLLLGLITSVTQFSALRNELASVTIFMSRIGREFDFVGQQAQVSGRSLDVVSKEWIDLGKEVQQGGLSLERARKQFEDWNMLLGTQRVETLAGAFNQLSTGFGKWLSSVSASTGVGDVFLSILSRLGADFNRLAGTTANAGDAASAATIKLRKLMEEILELQKPHPTTFDWDRLLPSQSNIERADRLKQKLDEYVVTFGNINSVTSQDLVLLRAREKIWRSTIEQAVVEQELASKSIEKQEYLNKLHQFDLQVREAGGKATAAEFAILGEIVKKTQTVAKGIREWQDGVQNVVNALSGVPTSFGSIFVSPLATLSSGMNAFTTELTTFHVPAFQEAYEKMAAVMRHNNQTEAAIFAMKRNLHKQEQDQILNTASLAASAITSLFPKSKAAAIAAAVINTAVAVTKALSSATPPLNFINAALVAAAGAGQIAAIRATSATGGGSVASVSGGGGSAPAPEPEASPGGRTVTIRMEGGQLFSSGQMAEFISRINDEVQNGATLIATETV